MDRLEIKPEEVWTVLLNRNHEWPESIKTWMADSSTGFYAEIFCEDMLIAKIESGGGHWETCRIACTNPLHGTHRRFANLMTPRQWDMVRAAAIEELPETCKECEDGWNLPGDKQAKKQLAMAEAFGMFRGVRIGVVKSQDLQPSEASAILNVFLSGESQSLDASKSPSDRQSARAFFDPDKE